MTKYAELFSAGDRLKDILAVDRHKLALYAAEDADMTLRLYEILDEDMNIIVDVTMEVLIADWKENT